METENIIIELKHIKLNNVPNDIVNQLRSQSDALGEFEMDYENLEIDKLKGYIKTVSRNKMNTDDWKFLSGDYSDFQ